MNTGIQTGGVRILCFRQQVVQDLLTRVKAIIVFSPAIEINLQALELCRILRQFKGIVRVPVGEIQWTAASETDAIDAVEERFELVETPAVDCRGVEVRNQSRTVGADRSEHFR